MKSSNSFQRVLPMSFITSDFLKKNTAEINQAMKFIHIQVRFGGMKPHEQHLYEILAEIDLIKRKKSSLPNSLEEARADLKDALHIETQTVNSSLRFDENPNEKDYEDLRKAVEGLKQVKNEPSPEVMEYEKTRHWQTISRVFTKASGHYGEWR